MLLRILLGLFLAKVNSPSNTINRSANNFIYPQTHSQNYCRITNTGQRGTCKPFNLCESVQYSWFNQRIHPTTCSFDKFNPIVCCPLGNSITKIPIINQNLMGTLPRRTTTVSSKIEPSSERQTTASPLIEPSLTTATQRISDKICEKYYPKPVPGEFYITVVGGELAEKGEFPFMAAIGWNSILNEIEFNCGGFLISSNFILTAAHCTKLGGSTPDIIRIGDDALNTTSNDNDTNPSEDITIEKIFVHPNYNPKETYNDIALIKLTSNSTIKPACLWQSDTIIGEYYEAEAIGYGHTQFAGMRSNYLMKVTLDLIENLECNKSYPPGDQFPIGIINTQMCAGDSTGVKDTCQGDSGGPILVKDIRQTPFVTGITSFGSLCASGVPSVYTRISSYLDWIEPIVWS